jgi:hypothetical protein
MSKSAPMPVWLKERLGIGLDESALAEKAYDRVTFQLPQPKSEPRTKEASNMSKQSALQALRQLDAEPDHGHPQHRVGEAVRQTQGVDLSGGGSTIGNGVPSLGQALSAMTKAADEAEAQGDHVRAEGIRSELLAIKMGVAERQRRQGSGVAMSRMGPNSAELFKSGLNNLPPDSALGYR